MNGWFRCLLSFGFVGGGGGQWDSAGIGCVEQTFSNVDHENAGNSLPAQGISRLFFSFGQAVDDFF